MQNIEPTPIVSQTKVILVNSDKGGDMKTTTAVNVSMSINQKSYRKRGYRSLLINYESSDHASYAYGLDWKKCPTMFHVYRGEVSIEDAIQHTPYGDIIAGNNSVDYIDTLFKNVPFAEAAFKFKEQIARLKALRQYTHIFIDTQPLIRTLLPVQAVLATDYLVLPMQALPFSVLSLGKTSAAIEDAMKDNPNLKVAGVLLCRYGNTIEERGCKDSITKWATDKGIHVFKQPIRPGIAVATAQGRRRPLFDFVKFANAAKDYEIFTKELLRQVG